MYKREDIIGLIVHLTGNANIIAVPRVLVKLTGDWNLAAMLSQLIYWSDKGSRSDGYIFKAAYDWGVELGVSPYMVKCFNRLPYVKTKIMQANGAPTTHYKLDFDMFIDALLVACNNVESDSVKSTNRFDESDESLTKITVKTTKDINDTSTNQKRKIPDTPHAKMVEALRVVTGLDMKIKSNAGRIVRASKELVDAGYTEQQVYAFGKAWKSDWRYKADKKPPLLSVLVSEVGKSKDMFATAVTDVEEAKRLAMKELGIDV